MTSKKNFFIIALIIILDSSFFYSQLSGATLGKEKNGYTFGISMGKANQFSDIPTTSGCWNTSLSMGKNLYYDEDSPISFDLLGEISYVVTKGLDIDPKFKPFNENAVLKNTDYDIFYFNYKNSIFSIGIDSKLSLNKYRSDQKWYTALLLGGNLGIYSTKMDLKDAAGNYYVEQFKEVQNLSDSEKKKKLKSIFDGKFESKAEDFNKLGLKTSLMPSIGLEAGYDITRFLSIFIRDKLYFTNSNYIDGDIRTDNTNDLLNTYSLGLNYYFHKKTKEYKSYRKHTDSDEIEDNGYKIPVEVEEHNLPEVKIIVPAERPYTSSSKELLIKARITNIKSALDVYCKVNGKNVAFDFNTKFVQFIAQLVPGKNKIQIYGKNQNGQSRDIITVFYNEKGQKISEPEINLINPSEPVLKSEEDIFTIKAIIPYVKDKNNIRILANGQPFKSYKFNPETGEFRIKVRLAEGLNQFEIIAENEEGKAINQFDIYYKMEPPKETPPVDNQNGNQSQSSMPKIEIIHPVSSTTDLKNTDLLDFKAKVSGVNDKNQILFTVNDRKNKYYDFDASTGILEDKISLFDDITIIKLVAKNQYGTAIKELTVVLNGGEKKVESNSEKSVNFVNVTKPDNDCKVDIEVKVENATSKRELKLFLNQFEIRNFSFNSNDHLLKSTLYLDEGKNVIKVIFESATQEETGIYNINCNLNGESGQVENNENEDEEFKNSKPVISVDYPQNASVVNTEEITFKANVVFVPQKEDIRIKLNDDPVYDFNFDIETGGIVADLKLDEGPNIIYISAENQNGIEERTIAFNYEIPLKGPASVLINSPRNRFKTDEAMAVFRATVENVKDIENIYVMFNGEEYRDFQFDKEREIIFSHLQLRLGKNTLRVEAENRLGSDSDEVTFEYRKKVVPAVKITYPRKGLIVLSAHTPLEAIVQNVRKKTDAIIYVNGKQNRSFKLENEKLTAKVYLKIGRNEIIVKATNDYGMDADTTYIDFGGKPSKPEIILVKPAKSGITVDDSNYHFEIKINGIKHSSAVNLTLNNSKIEDVFYYRKDKLVKADLKLRKGWNYINVVATNNVGSDSVKVKVFLE